MHRHAVRAVYSGEQRRSEDKNGVDPDHGDRVAVAELPILRPPYKERRAREEAELVAFGAAVEVSDLPIAVRRFAGRARAAAQRFVWKGEAWADISAEFGSIGVMTQLADYAGYYEQRGIKLHNIYSTLSEHKNAPFEAALKGDYKSIKEEELDPLARQFQSSVKAHRPGLDLKTEGLLSGRMFMYDEAQRVGLIDGIGTLDDAVSEVRRRAAEAHLERYLRG